MRTRTLLPELMDDPQLDPADHHQALRGLRRINQWTRNAALVWGALAALAERTGCESLRVLDIATGAADIPLKLWQRARQAGWQLELDACDVSEQALHFARESCQQAGASIQLRQLDILNDAIDEDYDVVMCSQFLHHLTDEQAASVLAKMKAAATQEVIAVDLVRSRLNWWQVWFATRMLSRSKVVHFDGPQSIRAAFTVQEISRLAGRTGFSQFTVTSHWPCRFVLVGDV